jgi:catechol 2,3-dioxygenase-like lactoylglutathione lyase family enzyme
MASGIRKVTIGVGDMDAALRLFRDVMQLRVEADYQASPGLKSAWKLPESTTVRLVELSCQGHPYGIVRLASYSPAATVKVRKDAPPDAEDATTDIGPKAIDFYVPAPIAPYYDLVQGLGYRARSAPVTHHVGDTISEEFVFWGPDGVPILLMVGHRHDPAEMRYDPSHGPFGEVATISIVAGDLGRSRLFYGDILGLQAVTDTASQGESTEKANALTGVPKGTGIHWLLYRQDDPGEPSGKILLLHFGAASTGRLTGRMRPGHLGFSLLTHTAPDLGALHAALVANGFAILSPPAEVEINGQTRRVMLAEGPNEDLYEFVEGDF